MLKIRRPLGRLIFNMGIAIPGKTVFLIETAPWFRCCNSLIAVSWWKTHAPVAKIILVWSNCRVIADNSVIITHYPLLLVDKKYPRCSEHRMSHSANPFMSRTVTSSRPPAAKVTWYAPNVIQERTWRSHDPWSRDIKSARDWHVFILIIENVSVLACGDHGNPSCFQTFRQQHDYESFNLHSWD